MQLLKIKPSTQLVNGIQTPCYGVFAGDLLVRTVGLFNYCDTLRMIRKANAVIESQADDMLERLKRSQAAARAMRLCGKLTVSRARLTKKTITAANKARRLGN